MKRYDRLSRRPDVVRIRHREMTEMHRAGYSIAAIARHFGCAWKTVAYVLDKKVAA